MARLTLAPLQLSFAGMGTLPRAERPARCEASHRTGEQWVRAARDYLRSRAKEYADAAALLTAHLTDPLRWDSPAQIARDRAAQLRLDLLRGVPAPFTTEELQLSARSRAALVDELMRDPRYSDARLLSRLSRHKLARMLCGSRARLAANPQEKRRA